MTLKMALSVICHSPYSLLAHLYPAPPFNPPMALLLKTTSTDLIEHAENMLVPI